MRGIAVLLRSVLAFVFLTSTFYGQPASHAPSPTHRVAVKLRAPLAADVEAELPMNRLALSAGGAHSSRVQAFMARHPVRTLAPLYGDLVRIKKQTGLTEADIVSRMKQKFARRAQRFASTAAPPEISRTYVLELNTSSEAELKRHIDQLKADPEIEFAEPDHVVRSSQTTPDDPYLSSSGSWGQSYGDLWGILAIGAPTAWNTNAGDGIVVALASDTVTESAEHERAERPHRKPGAECRETGKESRRFVARRKEQGAEEDGKAPVEEEVIPFEDRSEGGRDHRKAHRAFFTLRTAVDQARDGHGESPALSRRTRHLAGSRGERFWGELFPNAEH